MHNSQSLSQEQRMQQRLTPQQVLFGRLLEMTAPQIEDEVRRELDENPALEVVSHDEEHADNDFGETAEQLQRADYASDDDIPTYRLEAMNRGADDVHYETQAVDDNRSMTEELTAQLADLDLNDTDRRIATYIIGNLDGNGYLRRDMGSIADDLAIIQGIYASPEEMQRVFATVRSLEPAGIGAIDLRDCLLLQVDRLLAAGPRRPLEIARGILSDHFDLFSKKHFDRIASSMHISHDEMHAALSEIRRLNPKPGGLLGGSSSAEKASYITPDFSVEVDTEGHATVSLLSRTPELAIERTFDITQMEQPRPGATRSQSDAYAFVKRRYDDASLFIKVLAKRSETLMAVMEAIVALQPEFFTTYQPASIRPMILKDIAARTGLDLSVISRATAGKYVATPQGMFPLKMFFNERPKDMTETSSHEIIEAIRKLVAAEDKKHPLSDQAIMDNLKGRGYDIARRTVAKYRERAGLPVARLRKHF